MTKKPAWQLDREIAQALVEAKSRSVPMPRADVLRTRLTQGPGSVIARTQVALLYATKHTGAGYTFESSDSGVIRAFWHALTHTYYHPPSGAGGRPIGQAAGKKLAELWPIVKSSWPEALSE